MDVMPKFVDMAKTEDEIKEDMQPMSFGQQSKYPYGLCISFTQDEIEKLDLDDDVEVGDMIHLHALGKVTSVNKRDTEDGVDCRIEIQLTHIAAESEDDENEEEEDSLDKYQPGRNRPY